MRVLTVKGPELLSKYIGQSEKAVRDIFDKSVIVYTKLVASMLEGVDLCNMKYVCCVLNIYSEGRCRCIQRGRSNDFAMEVFSTRKLYLNLSLLKVIR